MKRSTQLKKMLRSKIQGEVQETAKVWTVVEWAQKETRSQWDADWGERIALSQCYI